ncbi:F-box protein At3g07870-like [Gastrolobium bilobum]|uniref:F-box protein At3g07870-like n=1 Tax=Gastrolobium bilobum TaxID=150636 RepID=UPI002AB14993|nr:F-box protein At3g07870-like [Gastrolobium bilobum]
MCDIMLKLSPRSIIRCSCVCTSLRNLVTDSRFQHLFSSQAPTSVVVFSPIQRLLCLLSSPLSNHASSYSYSSSPSSRFAFQSSSSTCSCCPSAIDPIPPNHIHNHNHNHNHNQGIAIATATATATVTDCDRRRFITLPPLLLPMTLVNSSNGLLCLRASPSLYYICNPLLGEILCLPPAPIAPHEYLQFSAFGFDPHTKHCKILHLVLKSNTMVAKLYQLGDETWSVIENASSARPNSVFDPSLNGALHWITDAPHVSELICSFDLQSNEFKSVAPPSHFDVGYVNKISGLCVGVLKGCLCLCYVNEGARFETWLMEEYGVKESWTVAFSIDIHSYCGLRLDNEHAPIGFTSSGDMWFVADSDSGSHCLVSYTAETGAFKIIDIGGITLKIEAAPHVSSFVSLKDIINGRDTHLPFHMVKLNKTDAFGFNSFDAF